MTETEQEWLSSDNPERMLAFLREPRSLGGRPYSEWYASDRRLRLFAAACCRQVWHLLTDDVVCQRCQGQGTRWIRSPGTVRRKGEAKCPDCKGTGRINRSRRAVEVAERFADGLATEKELRLACRGAYDATPPNTPGTAYLAWVSCATLVEGEFGEFWRSSAEACGLSPATQVNLLRDIVGNPYRSVTLSMSATSIRNFADGHAVMLAQIAYESRQEDGTLDPLTLLAVADALEEAGCEDDNILRHLRGEEMYLSFATTGGAGTEDLPPTVYWREKTTPCVRGCWVLDLLLGKE